MILLHYLILRLDKQQRGKLTIRLVWIVRLNKNDSSGACPIHNYPRDVQYILFGIEINWLRLISMLFLIVAFSALFAIGQGYISVCEPPCHNCLWSLVLYGFVPTSTCRACNCYCHYQTSQSRQAFCHALV